MTSILEKTTGLVAFVRTVDAGSFSAASRLIGSTQSAVSKSVARLERRLGVQLNPAVNAHAQPHCGGTGLLRARGTVASEY
jgi:Bacterial regulatory helix-turn-helix protein, lysR family